MTKCAMMQGSDVISIVSSPGVSVTILNVTNAVVSGVGPTGMTNLTTVNSIPQGSYGNFTAVVNASSQVEATLHLQANHQILLTRHRATPTRRLMIHVQR